MSGDHDSHDPRLCLCEGGKFQIPGHYPPGSIYSHADRAHPNHAAGVAFTVAIASAYHAATSAARR